MNSTSSSEERFRDVLGELRGLRIGYVPYSPDFSAPGDRRRFCRFASLAGLKYELPRPSTRYDVVVISSLADLPSWSQSVRGATKLIFDLPDSYLDIDRHELKSRLRGPAKFLLGQHSHLEWSYHSSLERMCARAEAVLCSTPEQRQRILPFNSNAFDILDFQGGAARRTKTDYSREETFNLVWEGLPENIFTLDLVVSTLARFLRQRKVALHVITNLEYRVVNGPVPHFSTSSLLRRHMKGVPAYLYQWNELMFATLATACDLAVIPMNMNIPIYRAKAENKLLLFWRLGLPTLTSPTPAYSRAMRQARVDMTCADQEDWERKLDLYSEHEDLRRAGGEAGRRFAESAQGESVLFEKWIGVFKNVMSGAREHAGAAVAERGLK